MGVSTVQINVKINQNPKNVLFDTGSNSVKIRFVKINFNNFKTIVH